MKKSATHAVLLLAAGTTFLLGPARHARAHCDTLEGPATVAAREALETGEFKPIQVWVDEAGEKELRDKFRQSRQVRELGGEARELADLYFIETAVRLHRQAEGMPYTGLQPAREHPDIHAAEEALETGNIKPVIELLASELRTQVNKWFEKARRARQDRGQSVQAGREYVDAYVQYVVYVHGLHQKIQAGPEHGVGD